MTDEGIKGLAREYIDNCTERAGFVILTENIKNDFIDLFVAGFMKCLELNKEAKWHDLRKDPNDLPVRRCIDNDGNVVRLFHNSWDKKLTWYRYDFYEREWWQMETEPIAWCEIPKYKEE